MSSSTASSPAKLYTPRLLALSTELASFPLSEAFTHVVEARSRTCGSTIQLGLDSDDKGGVARIGLQVAACAVGQSSAAILVRSVKGHDAVSLGEMLENIDAWLTGSGPLPVWPDFDALAAVRDHPGRHGALLLSWKAAHEALSSNPAAG